MTAKQEEGEIAADVAAKVYQALRQAFPEVGFRVIHRGYADTSRHFPYVSIWWHHDGPEVETVQALCQPFATKATSMHYHREESTQ